MRAFAPLEILVGCWTGTPPEPAPLKNTAATPAPPPRQLSEVEAAVARMRSFAGQMCACQDKVCADGSSRS